MSQRFSKLSNSYNHTGSITIQVTKDAISLVTMIAFGDPPVSRMNHVVRALLKAPVRILIAQRNSRARMGFGVSACSAPMISARSAFAVSSALVSSRVTIFATLAISTWTSGASACQARA